MNNLTIKPDEEKELQTAQIAEAKQYYLTPKFKLWEEYFYDKKNKETFGNATISYCMAYGLDPEDPKAYNVASVEGHKNLRKTKDLRRRYWEKMGMTPGKLLGLYGKKAIESLDLDLLNSIAKDLGVELPKYESYVPAGRNGNLTQINGSDIQINFSSTQEK